MRCAERNEVLIQNKPNASNMNHPLPITRGRTALLGSKPLFTAFTIGILAGMSNLTLRADRAQPDNTKTQFATPMPAAPQIDGLIDTTEWSGANGASGNWRMTYAV